MAEIAGEITNQALVDVPDDTIIKQKEGSVLCIGFIQKLIAELFGTYFLIFAGCTSVSVNLNFDNVVTLPGISIVWGLVVMVLAYTLGHVSGAHFNPAVTLTLATNKKFPWKEVPAYIVCQVIGSTLAAGTIRLLYPGKEDHFTGTKPAGSDMQAFVVEFIITFYLMFIISGIGDNRAHGQFGPLVVGSTVLLNVQFAGPITGASMNPARTLGPAIVSHYYKKLWIYIVSPIIGAQAGAFVYNLLNERKDKIPRRGSFLKASCYDKKEKE